MAPKGATAPAREWSRQVAARPPQARLPRSLHRTVRFALPRESPDSGEDIAAWQPQTHVEEGRIEEAQLLAE